MEFLDSSFDILTQLQDTSAIIVYRILKFLLCIYIYVIETE